MPESSKWQYILGVLTRNFECIFPFYVRARCPTDLIIFLFKLLIFSVTFFVLLLCSFS